MAGILTLLQKEILKNFCSIDETRNFYLTGGTALAEFYLQHRLSEDIDVFTSEEELILYVVDRFIKKLKETGFDVDISRRFKTFCEIFVNKEEQTNKIHIACDSQFKFEQPKETELGIKVDGLIDIATNKLLALFGRADPKDFIDIYFLVKEKELLLQELIEKAKKKDPGLDEYFLSIAFEQVKKIPDEIEKLPVTMLKPANMTELKKFFIDNAIQLVDNGIRK